MTHTLSPVRALCSCTTTMGAAVPRRMLGRRLGSALIIVMTGAAVMAIMASSAMPMYSTWGKLSQREDFLFVLHAYKRGLELYRRDPANGGAYPRTLADLLPNRDPNRRRYLRSRYHDPMTGLEPIADANAFFLDRDKSGNIRNVRTQSQESLFETTPYSRWYFDEHDELQFLPEAGAEGGSS